MARVPKWGQFEDQVPYTVYFDKARKEKSDGRVPNQNASKSAQPPPASPNALPNDPPKNSGLVAPPPMYQIKEESEFGRPINPPGKINPPVRRVGGGPNRPTDSPAQVDPFGRRIPVHGSNDSREPDRARERTPPHELPNDPRTNPGLVAPPQPPRRREDRVLRDDRGQDWAPERTPPRPLSRGAAQDGRAHVEGAPYASPVQPRVRPSVQQGNNNYGVGPTVPKFGEWDENPGAADGYTCRFGKLRDEKHGKEREPPLIRSEPSPYRGNDQPRIPKRSKKLCTIL